MEKCPQNKHLSPLNILTTSLPTRYNHVHILKLHPQHHIYTYKSFIPPTKNFEGQMEGNTTRSRAYSLNNNTQLLERLPGYQNILKLELNAILIIIKTMQTIQLDMHIFIDNLNSIFLINNHIQQPTSQHHHLDKLLITTYTPYILDLTQNPHTQSASTLGHYWKQNNWHTSQRRDTKKKPTTTSHIHIAHPTPYCLASYPTATHNGAICNLHTFIVKEHRNHEHDAIKNKFPYVDQWLSTIK